MDHQKDLERENAIPIDLVITGLYPFKEVIKNPETNIEIARGNIDVGGPSMLRAAGKNWHRVSTLVNPGKIEYEALIKHLWENNGCTTLEFRFNNWRKIFRTLSDYDKQISLYAETADFEEVKKIYKIH